MADQTTTKPMGLIRDLKINVHGILLYDYVYYTSEYNYGRL
jgi:hypothetical protein